MTAHLEYLVIFGEDIDPLQAESEHFSREFKDLLHIGLRGLGHEREQRVQVHIHFTSNELGAFCGVTEAKEIALPNSLYPIEHGHLICIVEVEFPQGYLGLAGVPLSVFSECGNS